MTRSKLSATEARNLRTLLLLNVFAGEEIGQRIAQARDEAGLTQEDFGDVINLSTRQVQNLEAGTSKPYKHLKNIADVTGKPFDWFLHGDQEDGDAADRTTLIQAAALLVEAASELKSAASDLRSAREAEQPQRKAPERGRR